MQSPVKKIHVTQEFGKNPSSYAKFGLKGHNGIDYRAFLPNGDRCYEGGKSEVFAPHDGRVTENVFDANGYGWYIKIEDGSQGSVLAHFHVQSPHKIGSNVKMGQLVGYQGTTGNSTGIHLHWGWHPIPRNKNNGYNGYEDQNNKYGPYKEETMSDLLVYLGVTNEASAKTRLKEHLGELNSKCNWGQEGDNGGYLGSARKEVAKLKETNVALKEANVALGDSVTVLNNQNKVLTEKNTELQRKLEAYENQAIGEWVVNGKTIETTEGNVKTIINYKKV